MSYSFSLKAATAEEATGLIREKFDQVVETQPAHAKDKETAVVAAQELVRLLIDLGEDQEINVSMNGYLSWNSSQPEEITQASMTVSVSVRAK